MEKESHLTLDLNSCKPLREIVFDTIRGAIIRGDLKPGERLMEVQLAEELGVSRTPVRESIRKLELEGLVQMVARKGAYVTPLTLNDLVEMMEIRRALESLSAERAASNMTEDEIEQLRQTNECFIKALKEDDLDGIIQSDIDFHEQLYKGSRNEKLWHMINQLREQMQRIRVEYVHRIDEKEHLIGQHEKIIEHIKQGDASGASKAAAEHIKLSELDMVDVLQKSQTDASQLSNE